MATSRLWVRVIAATVDDTESSNVIVSLRHGKSTQSTRKAFAPSPKWYQDFSFTVNNPGSSLTVELYRCKSLFRQELMGVANIPLYSVRHSNKPGDGHWNCLFLPNASGSLLPTKHQIQLDARFELPSDLPEDLIEALDKKLQQLDTVLEKEVEFIENQHHRLVTGDLSPPSHIPGIHSYNNSSSSRNSSASSSPPPPFITVTSPPLSPRKPKSGTPSPTSRSPSPTRSPFHSRSASLPQALKRSSPVVSSPRRHTSHNVSKSPQLSPQHNSPARRRVRTSPNENHSDRAQRAGSPHSSRGVSPQGDDQTDDFGEIQYTGSPMRSRDGSPRDREEARLEELAMAKCVQDLSRSWKIVKTEKFQHLVEEERKKRGEPPRGGHFNLAQLVSQLTGFKHSRMHSLNNGNLKYFHAISSSFLTRSRSFIDTRRPERRCNDDVLRLHVFKRTMEALIYPASDPDAHKFEKWTAHKPTVCSECQALLWGLSKQGVRCKKCGKICHERCASLASQECFQIHDQGSSNADTYLVAISAKMQRTIQNNVKMFTLLRDAFSIPEQQNQATIAETKQRIIDTAQNFRAEVTVKVNAIQGLNLDVADRRVYVTVVLGTQKRRTRTIKKDANLHWNEKFEFTCRNYHETIRVRVWNEWDSALATVAHRLTKEGDIFLGEKIIEVRTVGHPMDVWHKLDNRSTKGSAKISGSISLNISAVINNGNDPTSFHEMYRCLHEELFAHVHLVRNEPLLEIQPRPEEESGNELKNVKMLPVVAQEMADEFALRFAIEPIYRMMVHMNLLVNHHSLRGALRTMDQLLQNLKYQMFMHVAADNALRAVGATTLILEYFSTTTFGRDKFAALLDRLLATLRLDLQQYREFYPANNEDKLQELVETCQLMATVLGFQQQAMGILTAGRLEELTLDSMKACMKNTFDFIVQEMVPEGYHGHPGLRKTDQPLNFFYQLLMSIQTVVNEDRKVYWPHLAKVKALSTNLGDVSAVELWGMFSTVTEDVFLDEENLDLFPIGEYMELLFYIKSFYDSTVAPVPSRQGVIPEYPRWFVLCVQRWLQDFQEQAINFVNNAWEDDKTRLQFAPHEDQPFTSSVYQMFYFLHMAGYEVIKSMETQDMEVKYRHLEDFAKVICAMVQEYVDKVSQYMPECVSDLGTACMLLNNLQALRSNVELLYRDMGGDTESVGPRCTEILHDFQMKVLHKELSTMCVFVARSMTPSLQLAVRGLQNDIIGLKGTGQMDRKEVKELMTPLLDKLTDRMITIATVCAEQPVVLQRVIKELWYIMMEAFHAMLLPPKATEGEVVAVAYVPYYYNTRQCHALEKVIGILKEFFMKKENEQEAGPGLRPSTADRGIKQLRGIISLYRQTTEMLIKEYISDAADRPVSTAAPCGEVLIEVNARKHPGSGELVGSIRVISANHLQKVSGGVLKACIEINLILPQVPASGTKRRFSTHSKGMTESPNFNELFEFVLNSWENCELQVTAKSRTAKFGLGSDRILGVASVPLRTAIQEANLTVGLENSIPLSERGRALLTVLSVRTNDEFAKEFVGLKMQQRSSSMDRPVGV